MKVIILSLTPYKEKDAIVTAINEEGILSFTAHGVMDIASKNQLVNTPLNILDVELRNGRGKYPTLSSCSLIDSPLKNGETLESMAAIQFIIECTNKLLSEDERHLMFRPIIQVEEFLKNNGSIYSAILIYIAKVLKIAGYEFEINHCVFCNGKRDIVSFSFMDGGFVCRKCASDGVPQDLTNAQMMMVREIFGAQDFHNIPSLIEEDGLLILRKFNEFVDENFGFSLVSVSLLNKEI